MRWRRRRGPSRLIAGFTAASTAVLAVAGMLSLTPLDAFAAGLCATPGGSGAGGTLTGIVNTYYSGVGTANAGATSINVGGSSGAATAIANGDMLLVIQMQDADFDFTNTNSYGHGGAAVAPASGYTALNNAGLYEYVRATSAVTAGAVSISGLGTGAGLVNTYRSAAATATAGQRTFQVIRVPQYTTATTSNTLTAFAWNGSVGGVLAVDTTSTLTLGGTVSLDGLGFRGAPGLRKGGAAGLANTDVVTSAVLNANGNKGEGIGGTPLGTTAGNGYPGGDAARGAPANAGGGGTDGNPTANNENSGGGGGGNGGAGGIGGNSWNSNLARGGYGGVSLPTAGARAFMGGGGGAGSTNDSTNPSTSGGNGGGIALIRAGAVAGTGTISADGAAAYNATANDGGGGGGAGGTISLTSPSGSITGATLHANGGRGGDAWATQPGAANQHGPGGGGGGGWIFTSSAPTSSAVTAGVHGITTTGNLAYGSADGTIGQTATLAPGSIPGVSGGAECADLSITKTGPATVAATGAVAYTLNVSNAGPSTANTVSVTDTLPAGVTFVSASGTGWTCNNTGNVSVTCTRPSQAVGAAPAITVNITAQAQAGTMTNTAAVTAVTPDQAPANNTATFNTTVTGVADLTLDKNGPVSVLANGNVSYSVDVANVGPSNAATVSMTDTLPTGVTFVSVSPSNGGWTCTNAGNASVTCTRATWNTGSSTTFTIVVTAPANTATLTNAATIGSATTDPTPGNNSDSVTTNVTASADLAVTKTGPATVVAGNSVTYTVTASNNGPSTAATVSVVDTLPAGVTFVSVTPNNGGWSCTNNANVSVTCTRATWAAASSTVFTIVVTAPGQPTTLTNNAAVTSTTSDPNAANNTANASTTVTASANLAIVKSGPATVVAGGSVSYTLAAQNLGPSDAANVTVTDTLPAGVTFGSVTPNNGGWTCTNNASISVTCTRATWATGSSTNFTIVVTAPPQATTLVNNSSISTTTPDPVSGNNSSSANTTVTASADLAVTKVGPATVVAGGNISYTVSTSNLGPSDAANVSLLDTLPAGVTFVSVTPNNGGWTCNNNASISVTCTRATWATGSSTNFTIVVTAPAQGATLTNTAAISTTTADPVSGNNSANATTNVTPSADLAVTKSGPATVVAGNNVTYTVTAQNLGPSDAANVNVTDTLPAGVTFVSVTPNNGGWTCNNSGNVSVGCTRATWATGSSTVFTIVVTAPAQPTTMTNTASIASTTADPVSGNNTAIATTTVTASANLAVTKTGPANVTAGGTVTYTLSAQNLGPSNAANVSLIDTLPAGVTFGSVTPSNGGWTCTNNASISITCTRATWATGSSTDFTVVVTAPAQATTLTNTAAISSTTPDPNSGNNTSIANTNVTASADLAVTKAGPANVTAGGALTYTLAVANNGPSDAANVTVTDTLPAGVTFVSVSPSNGGWTCNNTGNVSVSCTRAAWTTGSSTTITIVVTAPAQATTISNTVTIGSTTADPNSANNAASATTNVIASADLSVDKSGPANVNANGTITYTLDVANNGPSNAAGVTVSDTLPTGVTFVSVSPSNGGWTCNNNASISVTCTRAAWNTGASTTITIVVTAPAQGSSLTNGATIGATTADPTPGNNSDTVNTNVVPQADLAITKTGPATVNAAGSLTYQVTATNNGPSNASNVVITDNLPPGVTFGSTTPNNGGWTCTNAGNASISCTRANWNVGSSTTFTIVVTAPNQGGTITNTATAATSTNDPVPGNNSASAITTVNARADLSVVKTGEATVNAAGNIHYQVDVSNLGPSDASNVTVTDTLPTGVTFVSVSPSNGGWSCSNNASISVTCTRATWATGSTTTLTIVVTAPNQATTLTNSVTIGSTTTDPVSGNNSATATTTVNASADLEMDKTGPATVNAAGTISYNLNVSNVGPSDASNVTVTDTLPTGVSFVSVSPSNGGWTCTNNASISVTCTRPTWATGSSTTITIVVTAPNQATSLTNSATISSPTPDPDPTDQTDTVTTNVTALADLSLTKTGPATVNANGAISYSVIVHNGGPSDASNVNVTDTLPTGVAFLSVSPSNGGWSCSNNASVSVTCTRATWATGSTTTLTIVVTAPAQGASLTNTATIGSTTPDPVSANNTDSANTTVTPVADLAITKVGPATVTAGGNISYTVLALNFGPSNASNVNVTDTLPAGVTFVSVSPSNGGWTCTNNASVSVNCTRANWNTGSSTTFTIVVTAPAQATTLTNTAAIASTTSDPDSTNNSASASTNVTASADLSIDKSGPATVAAGGSVSYTLDVANLGPSNAANVNVTDTLPAGVTFVSVSPSNGGWTCTNNASISVSCTRATWTTGSSTTITVVVNAASQAGTMTNTGSIASTTADPDLTNNSDSVNTTVTASADLSVTKTGPANVSAGGTITYAVNVANNGPSDASNVSVTDTLPPGVTYQSVSPSNGGWTCTNNASISVNCTRATWTVGSSTTITIVVTAPTASTTLTNNANITSTTSDPISGNNNASATTDVAAVADLSVTKVGPPTVTAAGNISYTINVANLGPSSASNVNVTDTLPLGVTFVSVSPSNGGWSCNNNLSVSVTCTRASWAAGATTTLTVVVTAPAQATTLTNTVAIASTTSDPDLTNNSASATTDVNASADLSVTKSGPATVNAGGSVSYQLDVANLGPSDASNVTVTDTLPLGVTYVSVSPSNGGWTCTHNASISISCTRGTWAAGSTTTVTVVVTAPNQAATLTNTASIASTTADPNLTNNSDSVDTTVTAVADLSISKTGPATVNAAGNVSYQLDVANNGPSNASNVTVTDTLPAGVTFVSVNPSNGGWTCNNNASTSVTCTRATWAAGSNTTFTIVVTAPDQATTLTNGASVVTTTTDTDPTNNSDSVDTTVNALTDLSVTKSGPATVTAAGNISYQLAVDNNGPSDASNVVVTDDLPTGVTFVSVTPNNGGWTCLNNASISVTCNRATWATGSSTTITIVVTAPNQPTTLTNNADVATITPDSDPSNDSDSVNTNVTASADLEVTKAGPATVTAAGNISYDVDVTNNGPSDATNVSVLDTLPPGVLFVSVSPSNGGWTCINNASISVNCTRPAWAAGSNTTFTIVVAAPDQPTTLSNTADITATTPDPDPTNNSDTVDTDVTGSADLSLAKSGPATVAANGNVTYHLDVANLGPSDANNVSVTDTLPAGVSFVSVNPSNGGWSCSNTGDVSVNCTRATWAAGASTTFTIVVTAPSQPVTLTNSAAIGATTSDPDLTNNDDSVDTVVAGNADLSLTKTGPATVTAAGNISYDLDVANNGPSDAALVSVSDNLPTGVTFVSVTPSNGGWTCSNNASISVTCDRPLWAAGSTTTITVVVTAPNQPGTITNDADISSLTTDPIPGNNSDSVDTNVTGSADLSVTKGGPATVTAGGNISYDLDVANAGPSSAQNVSVTDALPAGVTFVSVNPSNGGWTCNNNASISVTCDRATWAAGSTTTITIVVTAPTQPGTITNNANIDATTSDPDPTNDSDSVDTDVDGSADLSIVKSGPATVTAGGNISYDLDVANAGPSDADDVSVTDTLPTGVTFVSVNTSNGGWTCTNNASISVTCDRATWANGSSTTITIVVTAPNQPGTVTNNANIDATTQDPVASNNDDSVDTVVGGNADLSIVKSGPATVTAGGNISYDLDVANNGPSDAATVSVSDALPAGVTFVSVNPSNGGWTCTNNASISVTCDRALWAAGSTTTITIVVTAPDQPDTLTNTADIDSVTADPDPTNNDDSVDTDVTGSADLSVIKSGPATVGAGGNISYDLDVANAGPSDADNVIVTDALPAGVTFVSVNPSNGGWSCNNNASISVTCDRATWAVGSTTTITIVVTAPNQPGTITNNVNIDATTADPDLTNNDDSVDTTVDGSADLSLTKSGPATVAAGGNISYDLDVANAGPSDADNVTVTDTLPTGVSFVSVNPSNGGWTCNNFGSISVTCDRATWAAGSTTTITIVVTAPSQTTTLTNGASIGSTTPDPDVTNNDDSVDTTVLGSADLSIVKTGPATVAAGGNISYDLDVANNGPSDATNVTVTDTLPAGVTFVSVNPSNGGWTCNNNASISVTCDRATWAVGSTTTITIVVTAPVAAGTLTNNADIDGTTSDPDPTNNDASVDTTVTGSADLSVTKTGPATVGAGGAITYQVTATNTGPSTATNASVTDTLPAGVTFVSVNASTFGWTCTNDGNISVTCDRVSWASGSSTVFTIVVTAPGATGNITNDVTIGSTTSDPDPTNNDDSVDTDVVPSADLSVVKTGPATVASGGNISYDLDVANNGPSDADNVSITDTLPAGVTFVSVTPSNGGWSCTNNASISVTCDRATWASGSTTTITVVVTAPFGFSTITNDVTIGSTTSDPVPANNDDSVDTVVGGVADLSVVKNGPTTVSSGGEIDYTVDAANAGPTAAINVSVTDTLPAGVTFVSVTPSNGGWTCTNNGNISVTCDRANWASGSATTFTIIVRAPAQATTLTNNVSIDSPTDDPDVTNNDDSTDTDVTGLADLSIVKTGPAKVDSGGSIKYRIGVHNAGPSNAINVAVTDTLPAGVTFTSASGAGWTCTHAGNVTITCDRAALASGASAPVITVRVAAPTGPARLTNLASVTSNTPDPNPVNDSDTAPTFVRPGSGGHHPKADLSITKTGPAQANAGDTISYQIAVSNAGPDTAVNVHVTDTLPPGVTFVSVAGNGWTCDNNGNVSLTCDRARLADGATAPEITVTVRTPDTEQTLVNHANVVADTSDPTANNNASSAATTLVPPGTNNGGELPHTGSNQPLLPIGIGLAFIALGALLSRNRDLSGR